MGDTVNFIKRSSRLDDKEIRNHLDGVRHWNVSLTTTRSSVSAEQRSQDDGELIRIINGHGAVFDSPSHPIMGMFTERIARGAFRKVLAKNPDVRLLVNHDGLPYARTSNGSMNISEDPRGLLYNATLAPTRESETLYELIRGGYVSQNSFAFRVAPKTDIWECACGDPLGWDCACTADQVQRTITEISDLPEISVVTFPAYEQTSVGVVGDIDGVERNAQASDVEQREQATLEESSQNSSVDHATHIRTWLFLNGGNTDESSIERGPVTG